MRKVILILCITAMLLVACGGGEPTEPPLPTEAPPAPTAEQEAQQEPTPETQPETEQVTIRFAIFDWDRPIYESLIEAFEEANPGVKVQVVSANEVLELGALTQIDIPDDASRRLASAADVIALGGSRADVREGLIRDLTPFMEADLDFQASDFYPNALETHQWDGGTWALPFALNYQLIFFNKDAFDEAGVPYPEAGWSWDDFVAAANALTVSDGGDVSTWGYVPAGSTDRMLIESQVGLVIDDSVDPPEPRLDEAEVIDAVQWYADLFLKDQVAPYFEPEEESDSLTLPQEQMIIDQGQAAMWRDTDILWVYRNLQGNVGVVPFPVDSPGDHTTPVSTQNMAMSAGTQQPDAAWRFLDFLSRQNIGTLGGLGQSLPARRSTAETGTFWADTDEELAEVLRYASDHSYSPRFIPGHEAFSDALKAILSGGQAVDDALAEAQTQAGAEIQGQLAEQAEATPAPTVAVAPPDEETPVSEGAVSIAFTPGLGSLNLEPYRDLVDKFQAENPDVAIELKMIDLASGGAPDLPAMAGANDCFQWFPGFQEAENRDAILNLEPFLDADPSFSTGDFFAQVLDDFTWQGQLLGLPADITPYIVEYNKDLFDAAGLEYPALDWTPDDFLAAAVGTTQGEDEAKQYGFVPQMYELNDILILLGGVGAELMDENAEPPAFTYNHPDTVEAIRWYANLTTEHGVKPVFLADITKLAGATSLTLEREAMINEGRAAMWTSTGATAGLYGERDLNLGTAPLPADPGTGGGSYSGASGYFISAETEHPQACWQWITFLSGQPGAVQGLPARSSVAESNEYRQQVGAERADVYLATMGDAEESTVSELLSEEEWLGGAIYWLGQAYGQVVEGEASAEDALDAAQKLADDYRACVIAAGDFSAETWQACAQEIDPTLPAFLFTGG